MARKKPVSEQVIVTAGAAGDRFGRIDTYVAAGRPGSTRPLRPAVAEFDREDVAPAASRPDRGRTGIGYHGLATSWPLRPLSIERLDVTKYARARLKRWHGRRGKWRFSS
jgi:hypothetical protein